MISGNINFKTLPADILSQIPLSIRTAGDDHVINDLPPAVQYLLRNYLENEPIDPNISNIYDIIPTISIYNDLEPIKTKHDLIIQYLKNYLHIMTGSYPFDVKFGCELKQQLQTRDTSLRNTLIGNEVGLLAGVLGRDYDIGVMVSNISIENKQFQDHVEYEIQLQVIIEDDSYEVSVNTGL